MKNTAFVYLCSEFKFNIVLLLAIFQATIEHVTENKVDNFQYHAYNDITCFIWLRYMSSNWFQKQFISNIYIKAKMEEIEI
jgi:hypothetical protein